MTNNSNPLNAINVYGTAGNAYGKSMVGGSDVKEINEMLAQAFANGVAGVGEALVRIGTYKGHRVFEQKAADKVRISLDDNGEAYIKLIIRKNDPGLGFLAPTGGFKDGDETDKQAANREEAEEAKGKKGALIKEFSIARHAVPGDIRYWAGSDRDDGIKSGDIIAMSTAVDVNIVRNAHGDVKAGDDASDAGWVKLSRLADANMFGIKGHAGMILKAAQMAGLGDQIPKSFSDSLANRQQDILVGDAHDHQAVSKFLKHTL